MFDFLTKEFAGKFPRGFSVMEVPDTGTIIENRWAGFDDYLAKGDPKNRKNYRRTMRDAVKFKVNVQNHVTDEDIAALMPLVNNMDELYGSTPNPWVEYMHCHMKMVDGQFVTVIEKIR